MSGAPVLPAVAVVSNPTDAMPTRSENTIRDYVLSMWDVVEGAKQLMLWNRSLIEKGGCRSLQDFRALMMYAVEHPSRRRRTTMNVDAMVGHWARIVRGLALTHDRKDLDQFEFEMDTHLAPLLIAPVKQIREFYTALVANLKEDPAVPFFIWAWFASWEHVMLKKAPDGDAEIKHLKTTLAAEIAAMVEEDVKPDLARAITGALQWRSAESLEAIKSAIAKGGKARMVGRESCLFLEVETADGQHVDRVML